MMCLSRFCRVLEELDSKPILLVIGKFSVNLAERNLRRFRVVRSFSILILVEMWVELRRRRCSRIEYASRSGEGYLEVLSSWGGKKE
jgi:hypothetical protein